jgi:hypothetical protein
VQRRLRYFENAGADLPEVQQLVTAVVERASAQARRATRVRNATHEPARLLEIISPGGPRPTSKNWTRFFAANPQPAPRWAPAQGNAD